MKKRIICFAPGSGGSLVPIRACVVAVLMMAAILALPLLTTVFTAKAFAAGDPKNASHSQKEIKKNDGGVKKVSDKSKPKEKNAKNKKSGGPKKSGKKKTVREKTDKKTALKNERKPKDFKLDVFDTATDEIIINSKKYKVGGLSLEKKTAGPKKSKIDEIKKLAADVKKEFEEQKKANPRKKNRYSLALPESYHNVDMKLASEILRRVNLSSLSMFKTLYLPHLKKARSVKNKTKTPAGKGSAESALDDRTKMALLIVGNFINEAIEKHGSGNLSKTHKDFGKWINDGANLLAYGTIYPTIDELEHSKKKNKKGIISFATAKKFLRALIEVESSAVQMRNGKVNISLNMRTYPRDGSYVIGFMQESVDDFARGVNLFDPETNIRYTCKKLHKYLLKYNGNYDKTLRHYNAGQGNMDCEQAHRYSAKVHRFMDRY